MYINRHYWVHSISNNTRNSAIADKPRDAFKVIQGHQTW